MNQKTLRLFFKITLLFPLIWHTLFAQYPILYNPNNPYDMSANALNLSSLNQLWHDMDKSYIPTAPFDSEPFNLFFRGSKLFFIDYPLFFMIPSLMHEGFGHGARAKELGFHIDTIKTPLPPPFGFELPQFSFRSSRDLTTFESLIITTGGSEGNRIFANTLQEHILTHESLTYHQALWYLYANNDLSGYSLFAYEVGDIYHYVQLINAHYESQVVSESLIKRYAALSLLTDILTYQSFRAIHHYLLYGEMTQDMSLWQIGDVGYLPKVTMGFAPYGIELMYDNYVKRDNNLYKLSVGHSINETPQMPTSFRVALKIPPQPIMKSVKMGLSTHLWYQTPLDIHHNNKTHHNNDERKMGAMLKTHFSYQWLQRDDFGISLIGELAYKQKGFVQGEMINEGFIFRVGSVIE